MIQKTGVLILTFLLIFNMIQPSFANSQSVIIEQRATIENRGAGADYFFRRNLPKVGMKSPYSTIKGLDIIAPDGYEKNIGREHERDLIGISFYSDPGQNQDVTLRIKASVSKKDWDLTRSNVEASPDYSHIDPSYLESTDHIQSDHPEVMRHAKSLSSSDHPYDITRAVYEDVVLNTNYLLSVGLDNANKGALWMLRHRAGVCHGYTSLMIGLLRAKGIPAREAIGYYMTPGFIEADSGESMKLEAHSWPEVYLPPHGWVMFEPTISGNNPTEKMVDGVMTPVLEPLSRTPSYGFGSTHPRYYIKLDEEYYNSLMVIGGIVGNGDNADISFNQKGSWGSFTSQSFQQENPFSVNDLPEGKENEEAKTEKKEEKIDISFSVMDRVNKAIKTAFSNINTN